MDEREDMRARVDAMLDVLRNFPSNGQMSGIDKEVATELVAYGFIARHEVKKPCPTCGTERFDYGYFKPTAAGRAILAWADTPNPPCSLGRRTRSFGKHRADIIREGK